MNGFPKVGDKISCLWHPDYTGVVDEVDNTDKYNPDCYVKWDDGQDGWRYARYLVEVETI
jgi:hypothetical protein